MTRGLIRSIGFLNAGVGEIAEGTLAGRRRRSSPQRVMGLSATGALVLCLVGCGKKDDKPAAATKESSGNPLTAPVDYLGAVGAAQKQAVRVVDLTTLQQAIQAFQAGEERLPSRLQELVSEGYLPKLPDVPRGAAFAYNPANGQVKLVPAAVPAPAPVPGAAPGR